MSYSRVLAGSPAGKYSGGNSYNPQPTPDWQKSMTSFLIKSGRTLEMAFPLLLNNTSHVDFSFIKFCSDLDKESSVEEDDLATKKEMVKAKGKGQEEKENKENKSKVSKNGVVSDTDSDDE